MKNASEAKGPEDKFSQGRQQSVKEFHRGDFAQTVMSNIHVSLLDIIIPPKCKLLVVSRTLFYKQASGFD